MLWCWGMRIRAKWPSFEFQPPLEFEFRTPTVFPCLQAKTGKANWMLYSEKHRNWMSCPLVVRGDRPSNSRASPSAASSFPFLFWLAIRGEVSVVGCFVAAVLREVTSLRSRDFAKPEVAYCANASVGAQEKQRGSQEPQPRPGTRRQYLAVEPAQLEPAIDAPLMGRRCL